MRQERLGLKNLGPLGSVGRGSIRRRTAGGLPLGCIRTMAAMVAAFLLVLALLLAGPLPVYATELSVLEAQLEPCPRADAASQSQMARPSGGGCYALRGVVVNPGSIPVIDTDVFALILDASGEPVLPNRSRLGSIGDVPPGSSSFALRLSVPAGTPGPLLARHVKARGFSAPVRTRAGSEDELLPLEQSLAP
jgi:hypothetical protein